MTKKRLLYKFLPEKAFYKVVYRHQQGLKLDIKNPRRFTEKLWWLKRYYKLYMGDLIRQIYDKYDARTYVAEKVGEKYLTKVYGIYENADDIDFDTLPNQFALKITQSCGFNFICKDKSKIDREAVRESMRNWLEEARNEYSKDLAEEGFVVNGKAKIFCEEYLFDKGGNIPDDIRFFCFNGEPAFICIDTDSTAEDGSKLHTYNRNTYDKDWNEILVDLGRPRGIGVQIEKPTELSEMLDVARSLSMDFPFVRVDLYNVDGRIVFGELTWIPQGGSGKIRPVEYDYKYGDLLKLPEVKIF